MTSVEKVPQLVTRWEKASAATGAAGLDAIYLTAGPNFAWLAGRSPYAGGLPVWLSGLIVPASGPGVAVISHMHAEILDLDGTGVGAVVTYEDGDEPVAVLQQAFATAGVAGGARVGVEDSIPFADVSAIREAAPNAKLESAQAIFDSLRAVKDESELALLRASGRAVDAAYRAAAETMAAGQTMAEAGAAMYRAMLDAGADQPKVSGSFKHYTSAVIRPGDFLDIDIGASCGGYSVDTARNIFVGRPSDELVEHHRVLEEAYEAAAAVVKPGVPAEAVHEACERVLADAGLRQSWKVGHGVGLAPSHEAPLLQPGNTTPLEPGMVFTIDPGYFVRTDEPLHIEETVVVTETGCERLTSFPFEILIV